MINKFIFYFLIILIFSACRKDVGYGKIHEDCSYNLTENTDSIEGYSDRISYFPNDTIILYIHSKQPKINISIVRYGINETILHYKKNLDAERQNYPECAYKDGCNWNSSYKFVIPSNWASGMYAIKLANDFENDFYVTFIIKSKNEFDRKNILIVAACNTWQAYNNWGGVSFYSTSKPQYSASFVNFNRPNPYANPTQKNGHLAGSELFLINWLEKNGYDYNLIADTDLHYDSTFSDKYKTIIINGHSEYWTFEMYKNLEAALRKKKNLITLGANCIFAKVSLNKNRQMETHIYSKQTHSESEILGGTWRDLNKPESSVLGVQYDNRGYDTYAPYKVIEPMHWVFKNTGMKKGDLFGEKNENGGGASGHETDKITSFSPSNIVHLAKGTNPDDGGADMIYYKTYWGGQVFSVGSLSYTGSLLVDDKISSITKNVIDEFNK